MRTKTDMVFTIGVMLCGASSVLGSAVWVKQMLKDLDKHNQSKERSNARNPV